MELSDPLAGVMKDCARILNACRRNSRPRGSITARQAAILSHIDAARPAGVAELAERLGVSLSTMSLSLDRLARLGCIRRARHAEDGRRVEVHLTAKGKDLRDSATLLDGNRLSLLLDRLSPQQRQAAAHGVAVLAAAANGTPDDANGAGPARTEAGDASPRPAERIAAPRATLPAVTAPPRFDIELD